MTSEEQIEPEHKVTASEALTPEEPREERLVGNPKPTNHHDRTLRMGTESIPKLLIEFAIPGVAGMLVNGLYNVISAIFLGQAMGPAGLAVTTASFPITVVFMALAMLVGNGGNALCALRLGQGERVEAERVLGNTVMLSIIVAAFVAIMACIPACMETLLSISSTTPDIHDLTYHYVFILSLGFFFQMVGMGINNFIRTAGAPNRALLTMVIGALSSIVFNWLLVMVLGLGVEGSATANVMGQAVSCASVLWYFLITKNTPLKIRKKHLPLVPSVVREILVLGLASFLLQAASAVINFMMNYQLVKYGALHPIGADNALAAIGVVQRLTGFFFLPMIGIATAAQPLIGYNYGAGNINRVKQAVGFAILLACGIGTIMFIISHAFPVPIVALFGVEDQLMDVSVFALQVQLFAFPIIGLQIIGGNYFQATGQPAKSIFLSLTRQILYLIPALFLLPEVIPTIFTGMLGLDGVFFSYPVADVLAAITACILGSLELRRLGKLERGEITDKMVRGHGA